MVVPDKPNFLQEQGVLFMMTDGGHFMSQLVLDNEEKEVSKESIVGSNSDCNGVVVLRSAGIEEVVRRLGMLVCS